jgi:hypothetical protein
MKQNDILDKRADFRYPFQKECTLVRYGFGVIQSQTVNVAKQGLGVRINGNIPLEKGDKLFVSIPCAQYSSRAEVRWINKHLNTLGLKLFSCLYH